MGKIIISEFMDDAAVEKLKAAHDVTYDPSLVDDTERLHGFLGDADAIIVRNRTQVKDALLSVAPNLKAVGRLGVGLDNIDVAGCDAKSIKVFPATGANNDAVAEYVIATSMALVRGSYTATNDVISGSWPRTQSIGGEVMGRVMGLIGFGGIARDVAKRAVALGMKIAAYDPFLPADNPAWEGVERHETPESLLKVAQIVSLHVPLTDGTRHLIYADSLEIMRKDAILINSARGGVVDDAALATALREGKIAGAALDVFECEPLDAENGKIFDGLENIILTPHIAGVTDESNVRVSDLTADNILNALAA